MFRNLLFSLPAKSLANQGLGSQQTRNTFILKRRFPPQLTKKGTFPLKMKHRHFIYDMVDESYTKPKKDVNILLLQYVSGLGNAGDVVEMKPRKAYLEFLLPGKAMYCSPENLSKYQSDSSAPIQQKDTNTFSSTFVERTLDLLSRYTLHISMNISEPWVLEPWHVRCSLRKGGWEVPEHAITMPPGEIRGPDLSLNDKEFLIKITINKTESMNVRTRIYHWGNGSERQPREENFFKVEKESLFPEQAEELGKMHLYSLGPPETTATPNLGSSAL